MSATHHPLLTTHLYLLLACGCYSNIISFGTQAPIPHDETPSHAPVVSHQAPRGFLITRRFLYHDIIPLYKFGRDWGIVSYIDGFLIMRLHCTYVYIPALAPHPTMLHAGSRDQGRGDDKEFRTLSTFLHVLTTCQHPNASFHPPDV